MTDECECNPTNTSATEPNMAPALQLLTEMSERVKNGEEFPVVEFVTRCHMMGLRATELITLAETDRYLYSGPTTHWQFQKKKKPTTLKPATTNDFSRMTKAQKKSTARAQRLKNKKR